MVDDFCINFIRIEIIMKNKKFLPLALQKILFKAKPSSIQVVILYVRAKLGGLSIYFLDAG
jgi:hypothetical protein